MEWLLSKILRKIGISSQQFKVLTFGSWWVRTWFFLRIPWWITGPLHFLHLCPLVQYVQQGAGVDRIQQEWCNWIKSPPVAHCSTLPEGSTFWSSTKKGSVFSRSIWSKSTLPRPPSWRLPCSATTRRSPQQRSFWWAWRRRWRGNWLRRRKWQSLILNDMKVKADLAIKEFPCLFGDQSTRRDFFVCFGYNWTYLISWWSKKL